MAARSKSFLIWGAGGHGRVVEEAILASGDGVVGYVDCDLQKARVSYDEDAFRQHVARAAFPDGVDACALGIGKNRVRVQCLNDLEGLDVPPVIHPSASVSPSATIGRGSVVFANAVINAGAFIGEAVIINSGAIVEHDCRLGSGVHVSPGATLCGGAIVGELSWVGAGATVIHGIRIGRDSIVGAGSTVVEDVGDSETVVGSPARPRSRGEPKP